MKFGWLRVLITGIIGAFIVIGICAYVAIKRNHVETYPLSQVLWVRDNLGIFHKPGSPRSQEMIKRLQTAGIDINESKYEPFVLLNDNQSIDVKTLFLILNWSPQGTTLK